MVDQDEGVNFPPAPFVQLIPVAASSQQGPGFYQCPIYELATSASDVRVAGSGTRFITAVPIPTAKTEDFWRIRGAALLLAADE
jgi:hypothetical protein